MPTAFWHLCAYLKNYMAVVQVFHSLIQLLFQSVITNCIHMNKVFQGVAERGKGSMGWFYGLKLHLII
jgi:hypothetical protein